MQMLNTPYITKNYMIGVELVLYGLKLVSIPSFYMYNILQPDCYHAVRLFGRVLSVRTVMIQVEAQCSFVFATDRPSENLPNEPSSIPLRLIAAPGANGRCRRR